MQIDIKEETSGFVWLHRLTDLIVPLGVLFIILSAVPNTNATPHYLAIGLLGSLIFLISAQLNGLYRAWRGRALATSTKIILKAWALTWASLIILAFLSKDSEQFSRLATVLWAITTPIILIFYRILIRRLLANMRASGKNLSRIAIVGAGQVGRQIAKNLNQNPWLGYQVEAFYDDNPSLTDTQIDGIEVLGTTEQLIKDITQNKYHEIYICLPLRAEQKIKKLLNDLTDTTAVVKFVPDLFSFDLMHARWMEIEGIPIVSVFDTPLNSLAARMIKRTEDVILATTILTIIAPLMMMIAIGVKRTSPGPVIFKQTRYGLKGERITVYKFRSMSTQENGEYIKQATESDVRITPFGNFLRRTSLDELPQFINVLQGDMSIVGPRPHAVAHNEEYRQLVPKYMQRHLVKPGITGWAQVNGWRGETDTLEKMEKRIEYDLHYIKKWSVWFDLKIIIMTLYKGFIHKNAR